jgi:uncharacterized protein
MIAAQDPMGRDPVAFRQASVAVRGLTGLERLLYPDTPFRGDYHCMLLATTAADLAQIARDVEAGWQAEYADAVLTAGQAGNTTFLSETEARQALFTQLVAGLDFLRAKRIQRPLGTFHAPRPDRAEARASGRAQRNIVLALQALRADAAALDPQATATFTAFDQAIAVAAALPDATLANVQDPQGWLKLDILHERVSVIEAAVITEIGASLGVRVGFNAGDGD